MQIETKIGIDPGITGGIAIVTDSGIELYDMPVMVHPWAKNKKLVDGFAFMELLQKYAGDSSVRVTIELVHSMPKQGIVGAFTFGQVTGAVIAVVQAMGFSLNMISPQKWKGKCGLINHDKDASRILAIQMYPQLAEKLKLKKHNGRSDALFIAIS
jgi:hypothetical protein